MNDNVVTAVRYLGLLVLVLAGILAATNGDDVDAVALAVVGLGMALWSAPTPVRTDRYVVDRRDDVTP